MDPMGKEIYPQMLGFSIAVDRRNPANHRVDGAKTLEIMGFQLPTST